MDSRCTKLDFEKDKICKPARIECGVDLSIYGFVRIAEDRETLVFEMTDVNECGLLEAFVYCGGI